MTDAPTPNRPAAPRSDAAPSTTATRTRARRCRVLLTAVRCLALAACGGAAEALTTWLLQR
ncbi:hypothetical protein [Streptomyces sp. NPDC004134]|uniref:hypothetical protein n=1 Tax=Streptomyces sp. NPDC004134 TaxID=3364691 RepID=UPI00368E8C7D